MDTTKPLSFLIFLRDEVKCCPMLTSPPRLPSNKELKQWMKDNVVLLNEKFLKADDIIEFSITQLVFFPNNSKKKTTIV